MWFEINVHNKSYVFFYDSKNSLMLWQAVISWSFYCEETWFTEVYHYLPQLSNILQGLMVHSTNLLTYGLSTNNWKKEGLLRLIVFTIVKITSTNKEIGMTWTWDAVWKVLQPQPKRSRMVCTLASGTISAYFPKSGEASVVVTVWVWSHMPIHNLRRHSNPSNMYDMDMGCSLKGSTDSNKA